MDFEYGLNRLPVQDLRSVVNKEKSKPGAYSKTYIDVEFCDTVKPSTCLSCSGQSELLWTLCNHCTKFDGNVSRYDVDLSSCV